MVERLEEAGRTLLALRQSGRGLGMAGSSLPFVREVVEAYGWQTAAVRPPVPSPAAISAMDEVLAWVLLIPTDRYVLRRIVGARALVSPVSDRHLYTWRRLGQVLGADYRAVQRWHVEGVRLIASGLPGKNLMFSPVQRDQKSAMPLARSERVAAR